MAGVKALRKIQLGREGIATAGTEVDATTIWRGMGLLSDDREVVFVEEDIGYLSGVDRTYTARQEGSITFEDVPATFEQLIIIGDAGIKAIQTGTADTGGSGKIYNFTFPVTSANTVATYSIEAGDDQEAEIGTFGFVREFSLSGAAGEAVNYNANWMVRNVSTTSFTSTATLPVVEEIVFQKGKLYIDAVGGTIGGTQKTNTLLGFGLNVDTGLRGVYTGDGNLYFSFKKTVMPEITLDVTFEHDGTATAEKDNWRNETPRQIRLQLTGSSLNTSGSSYSAKTVNIDLAGKWENFDVIDEQDGNDVVTGTFRARYNSTAALYAAMLVVNEVTTVAS